APDSTDPMSDSCFALLFLRRASVTLTESVPLERPETASLSATAAPGDASPAASVSVAPNLFFIRDWYVLGPYPNANDAGLKEDSFEEKLMDPIPQQRIAKESWQVYKSDEDYINFDKAVKPGGRCLGYAFTSVYAVADTDAILLVGSDDGVKVLLN